MTPASNDRTAVAGRTFRAVKAGIRWPSLQEKKVIHQQGLQKEGLKNSESIKRGGREAPSPAKEWTELSEASV